MKPIIVEPYNTGEENGEEIRIGWASWDKDEYAHKSIKYVYRDASGKISRGCPELPFNVLVDLVLVAKRHGALSTDQIEQIQKAFA